MSIYMEELPAQRLCQFGWEALSEVEILALILAPGNSEKGAVQIAGRLLERSGSLRKLQQASYAELRSAGLSHKRSLALEASFQLQRRLAASVILPGRSFRSSLEIFRHFHPRMADLKKECFWNVLLDGKNRILRTVRVSEGSLTSSLVHPREVFRPAIREAAAGILFVHNHPSGDPAPSPEDLQVTRRLVETGKVVGIRVLDHIIIGCGRYFSFADQGIL